MFNAVETHAMTCGLFDTVTGHESKSAPGHGLHYEIWAGPITPVQSSGLDTTTVRVTIQGRVKCDMTREPLDLVETDLLYAVDRLMAAYSGQFQLTLGNVRSIDLLGAHGVVLEARPGYISQNNRLFRVADLTIPIIVNDVYGQVA
jgi:hypothetical protein